jgi:hypothetical protein
MVLDIGLRGGYTLENKNQEKAVIGIIGYLRQANLTMALLGALSSLVLPGATLKAHEKKSSGCSTFQNTNFIPKPFFGE